MHYEWQFDSLTIHFAVREAFHTNWPIFTNSLAVKTVTIVVIAMTPMPFQVGQLVQIWACYNLSKASRLVEMLGIMITVIRDLYSHSYSSYWPAKCSALGFRREVWVELWRRPPRVNLGWSSLLLTAALQAKNRTASRLNLERSTLTSGHSILSRHSHRGVAALLHHQPCSWPLKAIAGMILSLCEHDSGSTSRHWDLVLVFKAEGRLD